MSSRGLPDQKRNRDHILLLRAYNRKRMREADVLGRLDEEGAASTGRKKPQRKARPGLRAKLESDMH